MKHRSVQEMFSGVATEFGPRVAIEHGGRTLTYAELEAESNRLANFLLDGGLPRGGMVGLFTDNPAAVITGILGVLKAGGVFVPLDPTFPERRLQVLSGQVRPEWFVSAGSHLEKLARLRGETGARARVICLDGQDQTSEFAADGLEVLESYGSYDITAHPAAEYDPDAPCSVYFTSGSTGRPKAILGRLKGIDHFMRWEIEAVGAGPGTRVSQLASPSFDGFLKDAFVPLCSGGTVCAPESRDLILDAWSLADWLDVEQVEVLHCVPSVFRALTNEGLNSRYFEAMKSIVMTGEPLHPADVKRWMDIFGERIKLFNIYGTTETSLSKFAHEVRAEDVERPSIPVGRPIKGSAVMVINSRGQLCREEVVGEIHIRTPYRSHGYYNEPELTKQVFVQNPFGDDPSDILHKTGDFGRLLKNGELEILGRRDQQVKVRGVRVELGEIENLLRGHEGVADVAVVDRDDSEGNKFLVAYVTMSNGMRAEELRPYLAERLPEAMMPSALVELEQLPRTLNGKIDRRALPALELVQAERESEEGARTPVEEIVAGIWREVLRLPSVGRRSNFFNLGGHSLLATQVILRVRNMLHVELPVRSMFETPTVEQLSLLIQEQIGEGRQNALAPIAPVPRDGELPLSFAQRRMWLIEQMGRGTTTFHIPLRVRLEGALNVAALEQTFGEIVRRHESLRTVFPDVMGEPVQVILPPAPAPIPLADLSGLGESEREASAERLADAEHARLFDLDAGPLARPLLIRFSALEHMLVCTLHHIISDGWSKGVLIKEISALYEAFGRGEPSPLPEPPIQYADFGAWERGWLSGDALGRELGYWKEKLEGAPPVLELHTDRPRPPVQTYRGSVAPLGLSRRLTDDLKALAQRKGVTVFMTLLAGFQTLLHRHTSQQEVVVGTTVANRDRVEVEGLIGCFVNLLALRTDCSGDPRFEELLEAVRETTLKAYAHQRLPFEKLVEELQPARRPGYAPLVQAVFNFQNQPTLTELTLPGLTLSFPAFDFATSQFDLVLDMSEGPEGLAGALYYNRDLFDPETVSLMAGRLRNLLEGVASDPAQRLSSLPLVGEAERRQLLEVWGRTAASYTADGCIHELFERQAARTPDRVAVVCGGERLTYAELDGRADRLARRLRSLGAAPDTRVGIHLPRSAGMVVAVLGVLKSGAAYVPLDPTYPADRLAFMLKDSGASLLVTERGLLGALPAGEAMPVCLDDGESESVGRGGAAAAAGPEHLAYVIYTSGSTGRPKGVMVEHRAAVNLALAHQQAIYSHHRSASGLRVSLNAPFSFDGCVERLTLLLFGHTVYVIPEEVRQDPGAMLAYVERHALDVLDFTPSQLRLLIEAGLLERPGVSARLVLVGGEPIDEQLWQALAMQGRVDFFNVYGPTECTVNASVCRVSASPRRPTVGRPLANVEVYILDEWRQPVPAGVAGELYVGGAGLARGYLGSPRLTAEKFVPHPFATRPGRRLYRTADRARFLPDGQIEFLGRADGQVKIRGFRIEPGEVEAVLAEHEALKEALVVAAGEGAGGKRLAAYVVAAAGARVPPASELRSFLKGRLPDYMIPASFAALDSLPLTPGGKVDRKALPEAEWVSAGRYRGPRTPEEEALCGLFAEALGLKRVGLDDDFFELGGHSLLATRLVSRVRAVLGVELAIRTLFESPTVARLSPQLRKGDRGKAPLTRQERRGSLPLSYSQRRLWFLDQLMPGGAAYNIPVGLLMTGRLNVPALRQSLEETVRRHESLRTTFRDEGGEPVQVVAEAPPLELPVVDLERCAASERESLVRLLASEEEARPFDLTRGPLFRPTLLRLSEREHVLLVVMHHIISDGWSIEILIRDIGELYKASCEGRPASLPNLSLQYADFALWQRGWMEGGRMRAGLDYWRQRLSGAPERLELPADRPRPPLQTFAADVCRVALSPGQSEALRRLSRGHHSTLYMTLLAAFCVLLSRHSGQDDVVVGSPVANRQEAQLEDLIGFFVNTLVVRVRVRPWQSFGELLAEVRRVTLEAYEQQDVPFERIVEELAPRRSLNTTPVFQVAFAFQNAPRVTEPTEELTVEMILKDQLRVRYDLEVNARDDGEEVEISWLYNRDLFDRGRMERMARGFRVMLETLAADAERPLSQLDLLGEDERGLLLESWNDTRREFAGATLTELFEEQARRTPGASAVVYEGRRLTYEELNERANRLAHLLSAEGVGPGDVVGLAAPRSVEMVVSLLAIMKAGAAYLPIDPEYPAERVAFVLDDARPACVLTTGAAASRLPEGHRRLLLDGAELRESLGRHTAADPAGLSSPASLAYLIYTSGSTGRPKGVGVSHRACVNFLSSIRSDVDFRPDDVLLAITSLSFDIAVLELYLPLLSGATTVVASREDAADGRRLADALRRSGATVMQATPSTWRMLFDSGWEGGHGLKMISGGEALPSDLAARMLDRPGSVYNLYGPTETTVYSTWARVDAAENSTRIGRPVANTQCHLLDSSFNLVPIGATGELYIAGEGLAYGYLNRTDLTAAAFVPNPFSKEPGARMYRTGDLARRAADGALEYLGRSDQQLKVRGHRVEPGEVESALRSLEGVAEAAVVAREGAGGERRLVGYVVASDGQGIDTAALRRRLLERLPGYMVPQALVEIGELPLTPNGKVDRKALPEAEWVSGAGRYRGPRTPEEEALCGLFAEALGLKRVGLDDDFFELGGHSLLATRLVSRVRAVLGVELAIRTLFESPTVGGLSERLLTADKGRPPLAPQERPARLPLSYAQQRLWFIDRLGGTSTEYNMPAAWLLRGELDRAALERAVNAVVERHESLRTRFVEVDGEPAQVIEPEVRTEAPLEDLSGLDEAARRARLTEVLREEAARPFDLERGPVLRVRLLKLAESEHVLLRTVHHIVSDGWSEDVFGRDFATLYEAFREGRENPLKPLGVQYADFALWQRGWMEGGRMRAGLDYWRQRLSGAPERLELPADRPRPPLQTFAADICRVALSPEQSEALRRLSRGHHSTLYMTLLAAFCVLLSRHSGQDDVVVGSPVANRQEAQLEDLIGFFVNTLVMRVKVDARQSFGELLSEVKRVALEAYEQQDVPFERIVEELAPRRSLNTTPVFQVAFAFQNAPKEAAPAGGLEVEPMDVGELRVRYDLEMHAWDEAGRIGMNWLYNRDLFDRVRMERMARQYLRVLEEAAAEPARKVGQIELLCEEERGLILNDWNETAHEVPATTLAEMVERQATETPAATALVYDGQGLSYAELNGRANQLARHLRRMGVGPETPVGLLLERSPDMVVSLLAVLKAGGAYVPLDPEYPRERLTYMLEDAGASVLLTQRHLLELVGENTTGVICIDAEREEVARQSAENLEGGAGPENLAYVIYTSGSTGRPNGVLMPHSGACNLVEQARALFGLGRQSRVPHLSSFSFDASVLELFVTLGSGACLYLTGREQRLSPEHVNGLVRRERLTAAVLLPTWMRALDERQWESLEVLTSGAERLSADLALRWGKGRRLLNVYGPTEAAIFATWHEFDAGDDDAAGRAGSRQDPLIGRPVWNTRVYVLDAGLRPAPIGVPGELYIAGAGLARGYLNRPGLTAERFAPDPFGRPGTRMYRTGDLARWRDEGNLEYLGRNDQQVKIRGFRVEPGEIEAALREHPAVREALVVPRRDDSGETRLAAYVVQNGSHRGDVESAPATEGQSEHVSHWRELFDEVQSQTAPAHDETFNISGWDSSYTGRPIPAEEMREWVEAAVERIASLRPSGVLEIGCGTGLLLFRVAPGCARYCATDFSARTLERLRRQVEGAGGGLPPVTLLQRTADDFEGIADSSFDAVVINSVVQYFPGVDYLLRVLEGAARAAKPGGFIFVGDVRSLPLLEAFHASVLLSQAAPSLSKAQFAAQVKGGVSAEEELAVDPALFDALKQHLPGVGRVEVRMKRGRHHNELTRFRYDVILHVGPEEAQTPLPPELDWREQGLTPAGLRRLLEETAPRSLRVAGVPDARLRAEIKTLEWIAGAGGPETVGEFRDRLRQALHEEPGVDPELLWSLSDDLPYDVDVSWSGAGAEGRYDVVLRRRTTPPEEAFGGVAFHASKGAAAVRPWATYANDPLRGNFTRQLAARLGQHLRERLPEYMVPSAFVALESLPLTPSGKVDTRALPPPDQTRPETGRDYVPPCGPVEQVLAELWAGVLGLERVGARDSFFDLGGHSLLATQLISRVRSLFQMELPLRWLFEAKTVAEFAQALVGNEPRPGQTAKVALAFQKVKAMRQAQGQGPRATAPSSSERV